MATIDARIVLRATREGAIAKTMNGHGTTDPVAEVKALYDGAEDRN